MGQLFSELESAPARTPPGGDLEALWAHFVSTGDIETRNALLLAYEKFARTMAAKAYANRVSTGLEFADYLQYARIGMLEAVDRFDPAYGTKFETFAAPRITGAILNGLTSESELHEQLAARKRAIAQRTESLNANASTNAAGSVFARLADLAIGLAVGFMLEGSGMYQGTDDGTADNTYSRVELRQLRRQVQEAVERLPERQRQVIFAHYIQNLAFEEIAGSMQLSRGRVSQLHREGLATLRGRLHGDAEVDFSC